MRSQQLGCFDCSLLLHSACVSCSIACAALFSTLVVAVPLLLLLNWYLVDSVLFTPQSDEWRKMPFDAQLKTFIRNLLVDCLFYCFQLGYASFSVGINRIPWRPFIIYFSTIGLLPFVRPVFSQLLMNSRCVKHIYSVLSFLFSLASLNPVFLSDFVSFLLIQVFFCFCSVSLRFPFCFTSLCICLLCLFLPPFSSLFPLLHRLLVSVCRIYHIFVFSG